MASEWKRVPIADVVEIISGGTPKTSVFDYWGGDIPWLSVSDFNTGYRWVSDAEKHITERGLSESATTLLNHGDIIISARGTVGALAQLANPMAFNQSCYGLCARCGIAENDFLFYLLRQTVSKMKQVAHGGVFDTITRDTFSIIEVSIPPLPEQQAIAHILGTLDDKIELNRRMNRTLEEMARAIFKSWFVDFDPVRAKMEGRWKKGESLPGLPADLWDVFPDRLVNSELGPIPEGWEVGIVGQLADVSSGKRPDARFSECFNDATVPLWGGNGPMGFVRAALFEEPILLTGRVGTLGAIFRITTPCWPSDNTLVVRCRDVTAFEYMYCMLQRIDFAALNRGSTQPLLTQTDLKRQPVLLPDCSVLTEFSRIANAFYSRKDSSVSEICFLAAIRDTLLPKLLSGELRVPGNHRGLPLHGCDGAGYGHGDGFGGA